MAFLDYIFAYFYVEAGADGVYVDVVVFDGFDDGAGFVGVLVFFVVIRIVWLLAP